MSLKFARRRGTHSRAVGRNRKWIVFGGAAALAHLVLLLWGIDQYPAPFDDEGTYLAQAWAVLTKGELSHYTYWYDHAPLGWILLVPWTALTGAFNSSGVLTNGRAFMALLASVNFILVYVVARRIGMRKCFAYLAALLFAFSPLSVHYQRMVLLDNLAIPLVLGAMALVLSPRRSLWEQQVGVSLFALAVLTKETMLLLLPVVATILYQGNPRLNRRYAMTLGASLFLSIVAFFPVLAALKGELIPGEGHVSFLEALYWQLVGRPTGGAIWDPTSAKFATVEGWLELDFWLPLMGLASTAPALALRPLRPLGLGLGVIALAIVRPGYLPSMFVVVALPLITLCVAGLADLGWSRESGRHARKPHPKVPLLTRSAILIASISFVLLVIGPDWASALRHQTSANPAEPFDQALEWILQEIPPGTPLLVDNVLWMELVASGYPEHSTIWYYKLDLDPAVAQNFPGGWRDFQYAVSTPVLRATAYELPNISQFIDQSHVVEAFATTALGADSSRVEIRALRHANPRR